MRVEKHFERRSPHPSLAGTGFWCRLWALVVPVMLVAPLTTLGSADDLDTDSLHGEPRKVARTGINLLDLSDQVEYNVMHFLEFFTASIHLSELNPCGDWQDLAVRASRHVLATEVQTGPPVFDVQCYRRTTGDRTLVIHQKIIKGSDRSPSVFVFRSPAENPGIVESRYSLRAIEAVEWPHLHMAVVNDAVVGLVMVALDSEERAFIRFLSFEGEDSEPMVVRALFGMQKGRNQEFLAFEDEHPIGGRQGRAVFTRYGRSVQRIQSLSVEVVQDSKAGGSLGGTSLRLAVDRFRDLLHGFWLHDWKIRHISRLPGMSRAVGDDAVLSRLDLDPESDGPGAAGSWPHDHRDSQSVAEGEDPLGGCPVTFFVSQALEVEQVPTRGAVVCNMRFSVEGWRTKMRQRKAMDEYPPYSFTFLVVDSGFSEAVRSSELSVSVRRRREARPEPGSTELAPPFDHPNPNVTEDWCVPTVGSGGCGTGYVSGENWSGFISEGSKIYRSESGHGIVGTTCRAVIEGPWGLSVVFRGVGGCATVREVFDTLEFPDDPMFFRPRFPGNGEPTLVAAVGELTLHERPSRMYPGQEVRFDRGAEVPYDEVQHITLHPTEIAARAPLEMTCDGRDDSWRTNEVVRYLQDAEDQTAIVQRRDGSICEVSLAGDPPPVSGLDRAPVTEVWIHHSGGQGRPSGWVLVDDTALVRSD